MTESTIARHPHSVTPAGLRIALRVTAKARREGLGGVVDWVDGPRLEITVRAAAEDGKANAAVAALLAAALGVPKRDVTLLRGASGRQKLVLIEGDGPALAARLQALLA